MNYPHIPHNRVRSWLPANLVPKTLHGARSRIGIAVQRALRGLVWPGAALIATAGQAATFTVNTNSHGTDANPGTTTLVEAIQQANTAGGANVIELTAGAVYSSDDAVFIDGTSAGRTMYPDVTTTITIHGNGATLDATGKNARFFSVSGSGALTLEDLNLTGGKAQGGDGAGGNFGGGGGGAGMGGAIFVNGASAALTLRRASISACLAKGGAGAISASFPGPGGGGGGMGGAGANSGGGGPRSAASGNTGGDGVGGNGGANNGGFGGGGGGGIQSGNSGTGGFGGGGGGGWSNLPNYGNGGTGGFGGGGGGTTTPFTTPFASGGTFGGRGGAYNSSGFAAGGGGAGLGGAIFNYQGTVTLENVTLAGNSATGGNGNSLNSIGAGSGAGGAVFNYDGAVTLKHVTANANVVGTDVAGNNPGVATGGALYNYDAPGGSTPTITIYNSILANSTYNNASGVEVINNGSGTITASGTANTSIIPTSTGLTGTVLTSNPQLALNERRNSIVLVRPLAGSPALDAGDAANSFATDAAGTTRPQGGGVDIGAAEGVFSTTVSLTTGMLLVTDTQADAVYAIDPVTGNRTLVSKTNYVGSGPDIGTPRGIVADASLNIYVVNTTPVVAIVKIDPATGNRTTLSSSAASVGSGPAFSTSISGIAIRPSDGMLLVTDTGGVNGSAGSDAVFVVDPANGNRTILSDDVTPDTVNALTTPNTIIFHSTLGILVTDNTTVDTVTRVSGTGARTIFSSSTVPNGVNPITNPFGIAEDTDGSILLVESITTANANRQLLRLNNITGARALVSNLSTNLAYSGLAAGGSGIFVVKTTAPAQVQKVNAANGAVTTTSGNTTGDGVLFGNAAGTIGFGIGLAFIPGAEIAVEQPVGNNLLDGIASVDYGTVNIGNFSNKTFTIRNIGTTNLAGLGITIDGADAAMFTVVTNPVPPVVAGSNTTFTVKFTPTGSGAMTAALHIASNDTDENPFDINLTGTGFSANTPPTVASDNASVTVGEGSSANNTGTYADAQGNGTVLVTASVGTLTTNIGAGTWAWSFNSTDGSDESQTVTITATDGIGTNTATFALTVTNVSPTALVQSVTTAEDSATNIILTAIDPGADTITNWVVTVAPTNGVLSGTAPNLTYTPNTNFHGGDAFQFTATDSDGDPSAAATVSLAVISVNDAPVSGALPNYTVNPGAVISFTATATDVDPGDILSFTLENPPAFASITGGGAFSWRPHVVQSDTTNTVTVVVTDNGTPNLSSTNSFAVIVNPLAPVLLSEMVYSNGNFAFTVDGTTGPDYVILTSTNLVDWSDLSTNPSPAMPFQFNDSGAGSNQYQFYRVRLQP